MCFEERNTESRGLPRAVRERRWRTRAWRREKRFVIFLLIAAFLLLLAFFAPDRLVVVVDTLTLIGFGLAIGADHRRDLADALLVRTGNRDRGRFLGGDLDVIRDREGDFVAEAQLQHKILALHGRAIAHAFDLKILGKALGNAGHHVVDQRACRAPLGAGALGIGLGLEHNLAVGDRSRDIAAHGALQGAELALGGKHVSRHLDGDALGDGHWIAADARHDFLLKHAADDLTADIGGASLVVRHDAARRRQNGNAETIIDPRQIGYPRMDAAAGLGNAGDLANHGLTIDVFQLDLELCDARTNFLAREAADITLAL